MPSLLKAFLRHINHGTAWLPYNRSSNYPVSGEFNRAFGFCFPGSMGGRSNAPPYSLNSAYSRSSEMTPDARIALGYYLRLLAEELSAE
jgi:hypothetical protein